MVVGTDGSETAKEAVRQASELAERLDAKVHLVSAYEPVPEGRLREERQQVPDDLQWMVNPREDVSATLAEAAKGLEAAGVNVETHAREGDPGRRDPRRGRGAGRRPDRGRQQGHDRRQALPARQRAEQGLPSRSLQRDDHPDYLAQRPCRPGSAGRGRRPRGPSRSGRSKPGRPRSRAVASMWASTASGRGVRRRAAGWRSAAPRCPPRAGSPSTCPRSRPAARSGARCAGEGLLEDPARRAARGGSDCALLRVVAGCGVDAAARGDHVEVGAGVRVLGLGSRGGRGADGDHVSSRARGRPPGAGTSGRVAGRGDDAPRRVRARSGAPRGLGDLGRDARGGRTRGTG